MRDRKSSEVPRAPRGRLGAAARAPPAGEAREEEPASNEGPKGSRGDGERDTAPGAPGGGRVGVGQKAFRGATAAKEEPGSPRRPKSVEERRGRPRPRHLLRRRGPLALWERRGCGGGRGTCSGRRGPRGVGVNGELERGPNDGHLRRRWDQTITTRDYVLGSRSRGARRIGEAEGGPRTRTPRRPLRGAKTESRGGCGCAPSLPGSSGFRSRSRSPGHYGSGDSPCGLWRRELPRSPLPPSVLPAERGLPAPRVPYFASLRRR